MTTGPGSLGSPNSPGSPRKKRSALVRRHGIVTFLLVLIALAYEIVANILESSSRISGLLWPWGGSVDQSLASSAVFQPDPFFRAIYDEIDNQDEEKRCRRYGFTYTPATRRRRIFVASLVADESQELIDIHATEAYGVYHYVALLESNTTFMFSPRKMRFLPGSDLHTYIHSGVFGPQTQIDIRSWYWPDDGLRDINREQVMRHDLIYQWKEAGMRPDDIGIVGDLDEVFSRDFLRAAQVCYLPMFASDDCAKPKVVPVSIVYESSPECRRKHGWYHPDMILGRCIEEIGNVTGRVKARRAHLNATYGNRIKGYGWEDFYHPNVTASGRYPLWSTQDFRTLAGALYQVNFVEDDNGKRVYDIDYGAAFHMHNFFTNYSTIRNKYYTYGHPDGRSWSSTLSDLGNGDLDALVRCVHNISNDAIFDPKVGQSLFHKSFDQTLGPKPIYYLNETNRWARHEFVRRMVMQDEARFGSVYDVQKKNNVSKTL